MRFFTILAATGLLTACDPGNSPDEVALPGNPERVSDTSIDPQDGAELYLLAGQEHQLRLASNPTTGYFWSCEAGRSSGIDIVSDTYIADPAPEGLVGSGGVQIFVLQVSKAGKGALTCTYSRSPKDVAEKRQFDTIAR